MDNEAGLLIARIVIERRITDDDDVVTYEGTTADGSELPVVEALGMLALAEGSAQARSED